MEQDESCLSFESPAKTYLLTGSQSSYCLVSFIRKLTKCFGFKYSISLSQLENTITCKGMQINQISHTHTEFCVQSLSWPNSFYLPLLFYLLRFYLLSWNVEPFDSLLVLRLPFKYIPTVHGRRHWRHHCVCINIARWHDTVVSMQVLGHGTVWHCILSQIWDETSDSVNYLPKQY